MKTQLFSLSTFSLMLLLSSCAKNDVDTDDPYAISPEHISFRSSVATKSNDNGLTELKGGFNVIGLLKDGTYIPGFGNPSGDNVNYIFTTAWDWKNLAAKDAKLWPTQDIVYPLTFYAAYPLTVAVTKDASTVAANVVSNLTPAVFVYNTYYNGAPIAFDASKVSVDELAVLTTVDRRPVTGFADLNFKHIMANLKFNVLVPDNHKAYIQSIKVINVNKSGRTYDYKTGTWSTETTYAAADNAHFSHFIASAGQPVQVISKALSTVNGLTDGAGKYNTLKLMPQKAVVSWFLGPETGASTNTFRGDALTWKSSLTNGVVDAAAITKWHNQATSMFGMKDSKGWQGSRIEVVYCLVNETAGIGKEKNVIGYKSGVDGAASDLMVRVGFPLDITALNSNAGLEAAKRYTFNIPLGTADATNGILLDPEYKNNDGTNTTKPVDNPKTYPGDAITKGGVIQFNVDVIDWVDAPGANLN